MGEKLNRLWTLALSWALAAWAVTEAQADTKENVDRTLTWNQATLSLKQAVKGQTISELKWIRGNVWVLATQNTWKDKRTTISGKVFWNDNTLNWVITGSTGNLDKVKSKSIIAKIEKEINKKIKAGVFGWVVTTDYKEASTYGNLVKVKGGTEHWTTTKKVNWANVKIAWAEVSYISDDARTKTTLNGAKVMWDVSGYMAGAKVSHLTENRQNKITLSGNKVKAGMNDSYKVSGEVETKFDNSNWSAWVWAYHWKVNGKKDNGVFAGVSYSFGGEKGKFNDFSAKDIEHNFGYDAQFLNSTEKTVKNFVADPVNPVTPVAPKPKPEKPVQPELEKPVQPKPVETAKWPSLVQEDLPTANIEEKNETVTQVIDYKTTIVEDRFAPKDSIREEGWVAGKTETVYKKIIVNGKEEYSEVVSTTTTPAVDKVIYKWTFISENGPVNVEPALPEAVEKTSTTTEVIPFGTEYVLNKNLPNDASNKISDWVNGSKTINTTKFVNKANENEVFFEDKKENKTEAKNAVIEVWQNVHMNYLLSKYPNATKETNTTIEKINPGIEVTIREDGASTFRWNSQTYGEKEITTVKVVNDGKALETYNFEKIISKGYTWWIDVPKIHRDPTKTYPYISYLNSFYEVEQYHKKFYTPLPDFEL